MDSIDVGGENGVWLLGYGFVAKRVRYDNGCLTHGFVDIDKALWALLLGGYIVVLSRSTPFEKFVVRTKTSSHDLVCTCRRQ